MLKPVGNCVFPKSNGATPDAAPAGWEVVDLKLLEVRGEANSADFGGMAGGVLCGNINGAVLVSTLFFVQENEGGWNFSDVLGFSVCDGVVEGLNWNPDNPGEGRLACGDSCEVVCCVDAKGGSWKGVESDLVAR
jgi:hypothetical protein